jgi:hypothetical protein
MSDLDDPEAGDAEPQENAEHGSNTDDEMSDPATESEDEDDAVDE